MTTLLRTGVTYLPTYLPKLPVKYFLKIILLYLTRQFMNNKMNCVAVIFFAAAVTIIIVRVSAFIIISIIIMTLSRKFVSNKELFVLLLKPLSVSKRLKTNYKNKKTTQRCQTKAKKELDK